MQAKIERVTKETSVCLELDVNGVGNANVNGPVPFLNHMLDAFARHGKFDLSVTANGDVDIDDHHTVEDVGLVLGQAMKSALGDGAGLVRYGHMTLPMDDTLVTVAVDFCNRPAFVWKVDGLERKRVGSFDCELAKEFFAAFAMEAKCNLHMVLHYGGNAHHVIESLFKATARAMDMATRIDSRIAGQVPSTKGTLSK